MGEKTQPEREKTGGLPPEKAAQGEQTLLGQGWLQGLNLKKNCNWGFFSKDQKEQSPSPRTGGEDAPFNIERGKKNPAPGKTVGEKPEHHL